MESTCGFCIGNGQAPGTEAVSLRTNNRNFEGRSGTRSAGIYLVSPDVAALSAISGEVVDPLASGEVYPAVKMPEKFYIDDSMIVVPPDEKEAKKENVRKGPNIGELSSSSALPGRLEGEIAIKVGDKITTDHIMPAGSRLKYRSNIEKYSEFVFEGIDPGFPEKARALRDRGKAVFVLAGESYGQGSSREHAALCPMHLGVKAVLVKSIERIHAANLVNFGILPLIFKDPEDYEKISAGDSIRIDGLLDKLGSGKNIVILDENSGIEVEMTYNLSSRQIDILSAGGMLNYTTKIR
jgi:aconitate hydratase